MNHSMQRLVMLHTNDIHSHFDRMPAIAHLIHRLQEKHAGVDSIVFDCGDHMDRMRVETEGSLGMANISIMNATGYELAVPGNNEGLTFDMVTLQRNYAQANFPLLCCNLRQMGERNPPDWIHPHYILHRAGLKIGFIGATACFAAFYHLLDWDVQEPIQAIASQVAELRPQVDLVVVLSHIGIAGDREMAETIPGIDLIFGAHTHHVFEHPEQIGSTFLCAAGKFGQLVGEVELVYDRKRKVLASVTGRVHTTEGEPEMAAIRQLIDLHARESSVRLAIPVARMERALPIRLDGESPLGNLLASGISRWTGTSLSLVNAGQLLQGIDMENVTKGMLHRICPSPINTCIVVLTGEQLKEALEQSLLAEYQFKTLRGFGFRGNELGMLCVDGMLIEYDSAAADYEKIRQIWINGQRMRLQDEYRVGTIDMFTFGAGYPTIGQGKLEKYILPAFLRDVLEDALCRPDDIHDSFIPRWVKLG